MIYITDPAAVLPSLQGEGLGVGSVSFHLHQLIFLSLLS